MSIPLPRIAWVYLGLAVIGFATTFSFNMLSIEQLGAGFTPAAFIKVGFDGSPLLGSLASDFWVGSFASLIWMVREGVRLRMRRVWLYVALTFVIAWAFALPLFLFVRERHLANDQTL